ncbi:Bud site selection protein [Salix suchowensis]|nr:Bud site selection protein [Salix suchowensis]
MTTNTTCEDDSQADISVPTSPPTVKESARPMARAATDSAVFDRAGSLPGSRTASTGSTAPPVPPKDAIRSREELILEKRREARRKEQQMFEGDDSPPRPDRYLNVGLGRPSRRRSMSTGDADVLRDNARRRAAAVREGSGTSTLNVQCPEDPLTDSIEQELRKMDKGKSLTYGGPGDVNAGKAWRTVRRPSDMNEYSKQIKEYRIQEKGKAYGKVFVKGFRHCRAFRKINCRRVWMSAIEDCDISIGTRSLTSKSWRRRQFRVIGGHLVAFNDITKKATATIDLKRAVAIEDDQDVRNGPHSPQSDFDMLGGVERSFRLKFPGDEEIVFFADTDDEKSRWSAAPYFDFSTPS